jgi:NADH:ubiquinone oxidoreductase subunit 6 (subunit J)
VLLALGLNEDPAKALAKLVFLVAVITAIGFVMMLIPEQENLRGFWQRSADYSMFLLIVILGWFVPQQSR